MDEFNPVEDDLSQIEIGIRQLKVQYNMFFSGAMPRQPFETRKDLELLIKRMGNARMQRFADRYRYNALAAKYQTMVELWNKMIRAKEEGRLRPGIPGFVEPVKRQVVAVAVAGGPSTDTSRSFELNRVVAEDDSCRLFYDSYVKANAKAVDHGSRIVSYEKFLKQIQAKTDAIRQKSGCDTVTYTIEIKDGGVKLKARPISRRHKK